MKKRHLLVAVGLVAFLCLVLGILAMLPPRSGITKANLDRIQKGMPLEEVERIIGRPGQKEQLFDGAIVFWFTESDGAFIGVPADERGQIVAGDCIAAFRDESFLEKVMGWLRLR